MPGAANILDYLNEDCWSAVLDYVPVLDIIRSERVGQRWQQAVLKYLSRILYAPINVKTLPLVRKNKPLPREEPASETRRDVRIGIEYPDFGDNGQSTGYLRNVHWLALREEDVASFASWTRKLGGSLVAGYCTEDTFDAMGKNCPNLEAVMFLELPEEMLLNSRYENFTRLRQLRFENCRTVTDYCVNKFIGSNVLEALEFHMNFLVTGECLANIKSSNLKSLVFENCYVECPYFFAAAGHFGELRKLVLREFKEETIDPDEISDQMLSVLDTTQKLEHLDFYIEMYIDNFFWAICCLSDLKFLRVPFEPEETEDEAMAQFCPELARFELTCAELAIHYQNF